MTMAPATGFPSASRTTPARLGAVVSVNGSTVEDAVESETLANAPRLINEMPADKSLLRLIATGWNPSAFVDLVEQVHDKPNDPRHRAAVALQRLEWQLLFDHCTRQAAGG